MARIGRVFLNLFSQVVNKSVDCPCRRESIIATNFIEQCLPGHEFLDDRSEEPVFLLERVFILRKEPIKIIEEHAVENGALGMSRR
jgi:hypothetical protein